MPRRHNHIHEHMLNSFALFHKPILPVSKSVLILTLPYREKKALRYLEQIIIIITWQLYLLQCSTCSLVLHHCTSNSFVQSWLEWITAVSFQLLRCFSSVERNCIAVQDLKMWVQKICFAALWLAECPTIWPSLQRMTWNYGNGTQPFPLPWTAVLHLPLPSKIVRDYSSAYSNVAHIIH